jgi:PAS domain S-box-containing protein
VKPIRSVLVVDDSLEDRETIKRFLARDPAFANTVVEAANAHDALTAAASSSFDVLLVDQRLPKMSGLALVAALRELPRFRAPIVLVSASDERHLPDEALQSGAEDFVLKEHLTPYSLSRIISNATYRNRVRRDLERSAKEEVALRTLAAAFSRAPDVGALAAAVVNESEHLLSSAALVFIKEGDALRLVSHEGYGAQVLAVSRDLSPAANRLSTQAARTKGSVWVQSLEEMSASFPPAVAEALRASGRQALAVLPLLDRDAVIGVLVFAFTEQRTFSAADRIFYEAVARELAHALVRARYLSDETKFRHESELLKGQLDAVLRGATDHAIIATSVDHTILVFNEGARRIFGYAPEEVVGRTSPERFFAPPQYVDGAPEPNPSGSFAGAVTELMRETPAARASTFLRKNGDQFPGMSTISTMRDDCDEPIGYVMIARDVSAEAERVRELEKRAVFDRQVVGIVSHDLRNPLSAISMAIGLLESGPLEPAVTARTLSRMRSAADRSARMIRDLLDFTSAQIGGGIALTKAPMDLFLLCEEVSSEVRAAHPGRSIDVRVTGTGRGFGDRDRIAQVLVNLLANALSYSPSRSIVALDARSTSDLHVMVIHNDGEAIPVDTLATIFEPFRRGNAAVIKAEARSLGLGLYIVREIVAAHGGTVEVKSTLDTGTSFTVTLPRRDGRATAGPDEVAKITSALYESNLGVSVPKVG